MLDDVRIIWTVVKNIGWMLLDVGMGWPIYPKKSCLRKRKRKFPSRFEYICLGGWNLLVRFAKGRKQRSKESHCNFVKKTPFHFSSLSIFWFCRTYLSFTSLFSSMSPKFPFGLIRLLSSIFAIDIESSSSSACHQIL